MVLFRPSLCRARLNPEKRDPLFLALRDKRKVKTRLFRAPCVRYVKQMGLILEKSDSLGLKRRELVKPFVFVYIQVFFRGLFL